MSKSIFFSSKGEHLDGKAFPWRNEQGSWRAEVNLDKLSLFPARKMPRPPQEIT